MSVQSCQGKYRGVVDGDIDGPESVDRLTHHLCDLFLVGHVRPDGDRVGTHRFDLGHASCGAICVPKVVDGDGSALLGQPQRDGAPDALGGTSDQRDPALLALAVDGHARCPHTRRRYSASDCS